jgi:hypothetical protein
MSIIPDWQTQQMLGGGPSPVTNTRLPPPRLPPPPSRLVQPAGPAPRAGQGWGAPVGGAKPAGGVNTAPPPNPWTKDPNIYGPADTGWLDALRRQLEQGQATDKTNFDTRLADIGKGGPVERVTSKDQDYTRTADFGDAVSVLKELSRTGGYNDADLSSLRARGASPIRAAYAKAERDLNRTKAIQGGYAPGFAAASLRMAREQGDMASEAMQKVNADIAEKVASGRITSAGKYGDVTGAENVKVADIGTGNAQRRAAADAANALAANQAALQAQSLRADVYKDVGDANRKYGDQAVSLADIRQRAIDAAKRGQLDERNTSRAGALDWEKFNKEGGQALIDALMKQYGAR